METRKDSLYKYTRLEYVNSALNNGIFASSVNQLNDPYECKDIHTSKDYKVVCLSRSRNQKLMWSHYANGHRGCTLKIAVPKDYQKKSCPLKRVQYSSKLITRSDLAGQELIDALFVKDKKWERELEVRAVYDGTCNTEYWKKYRNQIFLKVDIVQVDLGCFSRFDAHYLDALIAIRDYNVHHKKKIKVRKYRMSEQRYEFVLDQSFDYIKEIADIINSTE